MIYSVVKILFLRKNSLMAVKLSISSCRLKPSCLRPSIVTSRFGTQPCPPLRGSADCPLWEDDINAPRTLEDAKDCGTNQRKPVDVKILSATHPFRFEKGVARKESSEPRGCSRLEGDTRSETPLT